MQVEITYGFRPDDYRVHVSGHVSGIRPNGATLVVGLGNGLAQTEADSAANQYEFGIVTKTDESQLKRFASLKPGETTVLSGPFEWVAVKSKYFVAAVLAIDSASSAVSGVTAVPQSGPAKPTRASVRLGLPIQAAGDFAFSAYVGPWSTPGSGPSATTSTTPIPTGGRDSAPSSGRWRWSPAGSWSGCTSTCILAYGMVLVLFGIMIRILLWPLNQKGMRASIKMQALQPEMKVLQDQHKDDPQAMQAEVFKLYKKHNVNPFSGCWPMLLPWPILLALFFVFQNTIELRGQPFLWLPDLSLKDPLFILPVLMGLSLFAVSKVGMIGVPPNPQMKTMLYVMPVMMTVLFFNFASGLNLYYFIQNLVSVPQQWMLAKERLKNQPPPAPPPEVKTKKK